MYDPIQPLAHPAPPTYGATNTGRGAIGRGLICIGAVAIQIIYSGTAMAVAALRYVSGGKDMRNSLRIWESILVMGGR